MKNLKIDEIIQLIKKGETFEAVAKDHSFHIKINKYVPYCCMAIHDGSNLRGELSSKIALDEYERWFEEDPYTGEFIDSLPITIIGKDSRFEYDLNRRSEDCIYEEAWGKNVWKTKLTPKQKQTSLKKHHNFYAVVKVLIQKLNTLYNSCVIYDIHSYNYVRWERSTPLFNIGVENIDMDKFAPYVNHWREELASISLPGIKNISAINDVFFGRGYNLEFITKEFPKVLVLATEIKKVYCNEQTGEDYPEIITILKQSFKEAIITNAQHYIDKETNWKSKASVHLLDRKEDTALYSIDNKLFKLFKGFELLANVNPLNTIREQRRFEKNKFSELPKFKYSPIKINPFELKQKIGALQTNQISDVSIRNLYEASINSYFDKIDLLSTLNSEKFLYNSLRYFGRPTKIDLQNAHYLLHLPPVPSEPKRTPHLSIDNAIEIFQNGLNDYGIQSKIELSNKVISQIMVLNSKKTILIRPDARFTEKEAYALVEHEIGVHMVTTQNSSKQKLKIFNLGLPVNTKTQEGLAILSEYLSGNISLKRLKKLAMRVIITDMMCNGADFIECFNYLKHSLNMNTGDAFTIVTRIFRGGGFTKDYLYLSGFVEILKLWKSNQSLVPLLVGKTSSDYYDTINEMINREMIQNPTFITRSFAKRNPKENDKIFEYIISGLK